MNMSKMCVWVVARLPQRLKSTFLEIFSSLFGFFCLFYNYIDFSAVWAKNKRPRRRQFQQIYMRNTSYQVYEGQVLQICIIGPLQDSCDLIWIFYWNLVNVLSCIICVFLRSCPNMRTMTWHFLISHSSRKLKLLTDVEAYIFSLLSEKGLQSHESIPLRVKIHGMFSYIILNYCSRD